MTYLIYKRTWRSFKIYIPIVLVIPFVALTLFILRKGGTITAVTSEVDTFSYYHVLQNINGTGFAIVLLVISIIFNLLFCNKIERFLFGLFPVLCFITILNPFLSKWVATLITGIPVYWRLFWILQINFVTCTFFIRYIQRSKFKKLCCIAIILLISFTGTSLINNNYFSIATNYEKMPDASKQICDKILEKHGGLLLIPEHYGYSIRQKTGDIQLSRSRYSTNAYTVPEDNVNITILYDTLYSQRVWDSTVDALIKHYNIDFIVIYQDTHMTTPVPNYIEKIWSNDELILYKIN